MFIIHTHSKYTMETLKAAQTHICAQSVTNTGIQLIPIKGSLKKKCDGHFSIPGSMNTNEQQIFYIGL